MLAQTQHESFSPPFSNGGGYLGQRPKSPSADGEILYGSIAQEWVNFHMLAYEKRANPRRGFAFS